MDVESLLQLLKLGEGQDLEFKRAEGGLPRSLWESLSALANTAGGTIVLGISENEEFEFEITGVRGPRRLVKAFWDVHNNPQKLSAPICTDKDVRIVSVDGHHVIIIEIPRASRLQRPVFINNNPVIGTYKRNYEGDYHCTRTELRQMFRDASDETQDATVLIHFGLKDLDAETIEFFRNRFDAHDHDHPFLKQLGVDFLRAIGAWGTDSETGREAPTLAGMLMFGLELSLLRAVPAFHVDYQEQKSTDPDVRWTHRITNDGRWEGNLFKFYLRVYPRLVEDVDVPFKLDKNSVRIEETHVHQALREALINTLIHADHRSPLSITVIKRPHAFIFRNPGWLRITREELYRGGVSSVRNHNLQKMFRLLGLGEKSGAGFQKILRAWQEQHWLIPLVEENFGSEMTTISLPVASMIPEKVERELRYRVGGAFNSLDELDRVILMLAHRFGEISNADIQPFRSEHPNDIGLRLKRMVIRGWLTKGGWGRGTKYQWIRQTPTPAPDIRNSGHLPVDSGHLSPDSGHLKPESGHVSGNHDPATTEMELELQAVAARVAKAGKVEASTLRDVIIELSQGRFLTAEAFGSLLNRNADKLRRRYLSPMVKAGTLRLKYPLSRNRPDQAYTAAQPDQQ